MPGAEARVRKETKAKYLLIDWVFPGTNISPSEIWTYRVG